MEGKFLEVSVACLPGRAPPSGASVSRGHRVREGARSRPLWRLRGEGMCLKEVRGNRQERK